MVKDPRTGAAGEDLAGPGESVTAGHLDVHEDHVGVHGERGGDDGGAAGCLADDLDSRLRAEDRPESVAQQVMVISEQDPNRAGHGVAWVSTGKRAPFRSARHVRRAGPA